ncbi:hypothetical protein AF332_20250 [Sporosarcina globispora]|uniref:Uncharacterized protein n=1 Tax=Sporosarcina globispora TaxID=1459 RepID=A0A0M0GGA3_SPOGL|nr:ankyrin repeat domain-containing protein [Sporosarcina globispora]KON88899.1 hypothetical protein AF332_20250 [Sporosarcina globispora]
MINSDYNLINRPESKVLISNVLNNDVEGVIRSFEKYRAAPHSKSQSGVSALELAIENDNKYIVAFLIRYGALPNAIEKEAAFKKGNQGIIELVETGKYLKIIREYEFFKKE